MMICEFGFFLLVGGLAAEIEVREPYQMAMSIMNKEVFTMAAISNAQVTALISVNWKTIEYEVGDVLEILLGQALNNAFIER
uniref:Uncharacterized protein n=1 Tax=Tanacetum cinerariifolium TaxID=118510 RepID=A0A6L2M883_TANCI|nr:hypothetical protein [Tanacetum cinerariifolium]